jgi:thioredoxin-dependent peroxiredoxin
MATTAFQGNPVQTSGNLPAVGSQAPDFKLVKGDLSELTLSSLRGKKVVLNIFPSVDTGVCAASVRRFNKEASSLPNTVVVCVSRDLPFAAGRFCAAEGLNNVVTASEYRDQDFSKAYGVLITDTAFAGLHARSVVVVDENGVVKHTELVSEITHEPNYEAALKAL